MNTRANPPLLEEAESVRKRWSFHRLMAAAVAALGALVLFWFDPNYYSFYPGCAFHRVTGLLCPGCGSLRAMHQLLHGHLAAAFRLNPLLITSLPILAGYAAAKSFLRKPCPERAEFAFHPKLWLLILVIALAFTVWRNVPGSMFNTLPPP